MKNPLLWLLLLAIPLAGCASGAPRKPADEDSGSAAVADVPRVTGNRIRVEWRNLKPTRKDMPLGLMNVSSPDLKLIYRDRERFRGVKPIDDESMGVLLAALEHVDFYDHATEGIGLDELRMGQAFGAVHVQRGAKEWTLLFGPNMGNTEIPTVYVEAKNIIIEFHSKTFSPMPASSTEGERVFRVPRPTRTKP